MKREADVIVVGSGAAGATAARELARAGRDVLLLERGGYQRSLLGTQIGAARIADRIGLRFSKEGLQCVRGLTTGGTTLMTCGTYKAPPAYLQEEYGIDLTAETAVTVRELGVNKLPDRLLEGSSLTLMEAANQLGYHWSRLDKFIDPNRCKARCSSCMLGCPHGAKWTARRFVADARHAGASLVQHVNVLRVDHAGGRVQGVVARVRHRKVTFRAPLVILAAGGMGTAPILQRSGIPQAGKGIFIDPLVVVYGAGPSASLGTANNPPMSVGTWEFHDSEGFMLAPLIDPWLLYPAQVGLVSPAKALGVLRYRRTMGIMVKIRDDMAGELFGDGSFSKPLTDADRVKLDRGASISEEVLSKAGCKSLSRTAIRGAHPGGACAIGQVVDTDLQTEIPGLYVSDASVFPRALGAPVVASLVALNKRLVRHLEQERSSR